MGGFFSQPEPPAPPPVVMTTVDPDAEARKARVEAMERNRRGRASLIATSERGLDETLGLQSQAQPKNLLGG